MLNSNSKFLPILFFVGIYLFFCFSSSSIIIDDAYITFQYAKNFSEYGKPWYNLDPYFQGNGQTSLLWMWILALLIFFGWKPELSFIWLNVLMGGFLIFKLVKSLVFNKDQLILTSFNFFLSCFIVYWLYLNSLHGLETVLAALILYFFVKNWNRSQNYFGLLLLLVRPEYALFLIFWTLDSKIFTKDFYQKLMISLTGGIVFAIYYLVFFDFYIPLPFLFKSQFKTYTFPQISVYLGLLLIFIPLFISLLQRKKFAILIPLNIFIFYYTFHVQSYSSGIFTRYYFPLIILYSVYPIVSLDRSIHKYAPFINSVFLIFGMLRMADLSSNFFIQRKSIVTENVGYYDSYRNLIKLFKKEDKVTVNDAGYTAYFSDVMCYDGIGLNDASIVVARKNNDEKAYQKYIETKKINYVTIGSTSSKEIIPRSDAENFVSKSLDLKSEIPYRIFPMDEGFYLWVFYYEKGYQKGDNL